MARRILLCAVAALLVPPAAHAAAVPPLVKRYAPLLRVHPREHDLPMTAQDFIDHSSLRFSRVRHFDRTLAERGQVVAASLGAGCADAPSGCYESDGYQASDHTRPHDEPPPSGAAGFYLDVDDAWRDGTRSQPTFYYEVHRAADRITIDYWFFYGYSNPRVLGEHVSTTLGSHEGDWEGVEVMLQAPDRPLALRFHEHGGHVDVAWPDVCKWTLVQQDCSAPGGHPVVYSAHGSHASYATPGVTPQCWRPHLCTDDVRMDGGPAYHVWSRPLLSARAEPWFGFGGAWGHVGLLRDTTGPLGPSRYKR